MVYWKLIEYVRSTKFIFDTRVEMRIRTEIVIRIFFKRRENF